MILDVGVCLFEFSKEKKRYISRIASLNRKLLDLLILSNICFRKESKNIIYTPSILTFV